MDFIDYSEIDCSPEPELRLWLWGCSKKARNKRKQVGREISDVRSMNAEKIDSFDKLLVSLGL